jgi:hypothetical protein
MDKCQFNIPFYYFWKAWWILDFYVDYSNTLSNTEETTYDKIS